MLYIYVLPHQLHMFLKIPNAHCLGPEDPRRKASGVLGWAAVAVRCCEQRGLDLDVNTTCQITSSNHPMAEDL